MTKCPFPAAVDLQEVEQLCDDWVPEPLVPSIALEDEVPEPVLIER